MPKSILIVDDHERTRKLVRSFLESLDGFVCGEAVDGLDAIQRVASQDPDLIVLDFQMPRMNGLEAAHVAVPIILFTMHNDVLRPADIAALGIKAVVSKGFLGCVSFSRSAFACLKTAD